MRVLLGHHVGDQPLELGIPSDFRGQESVRVVLGDGGAAEALRHATASRPEIIDALRRLLARADPGWSLARIQDHGVLEEVMWRVRSGQLCFSSPLPRRMRVAPTSEKSAPAPPPGPSQPPRRVAEPAPTAAAAAGAAPVQTRGAPGASPLLAAGPVDLGKHFKPDKNKKGFIEVELVDVDGKPIAGQPFRIVLPDGTRKEGKLNAEGFVRVEGFDPGECAVIFQKLSPAD